jgi:predicted enzyme related to lactoylglutathione lyase
MRPVNATWLGYRYAEVGARTGYSSGTFCWAHLGARVAALHVATDQPPHWNNYVSVEDADVVARRAQELGGSVFAGPLDVLSAGRMAAISDPQGAMVIAWQPAELVGAEVVNEPGAMAWNDLLTSDVEAARTFYEALFGWRVDAVPESGGRYSVIRGADGSNCGMMPLPAPGIPPFAAGRRSRPVRELGKGFIGGLDPVALAGRVLVQEEAADDRERERRLGFGL